MNIKNRLLLFDGFDPALNLLGVNAAELLIGLVDGEVDDGVHLGEYAEELLELLLGEVDLLLVLRLGIELNHLDILLLHPQQYLKLLRPLNPLLMPLIRRPPLLNQPLFNHMNLPRSIIYLLSQYIHPILYSLNSLIHQIKCLLIGLLGIV